MASSLSDDDDDCLIVDETHNEVWFLPIDKNWQVSKCQQFNLPFEAPIALNLQQPVPATVPNKLKNVKGDGNCFYRCLSFCITGEEYYHPLIRQHLHLFIEENPELVKRIANEDYKSDQVSLNGKWPTEIEIFLSAGMLKTNIYTYKDDKWLMFGADGRLKTEDIRENAIYLLNYMNHYQVVVSVQEPCNSIGKTDYTLGPPTAITGGVEEPLDKKSHRENILRSNFTWDQLTVPYDEVPRPQESNTLANSVTDGLETLHERDNHPKINNSSRSTPDHRTKASNTQGESEKKETPSFNRRSCLPSSRGGNGVVKRIGRGLKTNLTSARITTVPGKLDRPQEEKYFKFIPRSHSTMNQLTTAFDVNEETQERGNIIVRSDLNLSQPTTITLGSEDPHIMKNRFIINSQSILPIDQLSTTSDSANEPHKNRDPTSSANQVSSKELEEKKNHPWIPNLPLEQLTPDTDGLEELCKKENRFINDSSCNVSLDQPTTTPDNAKEPLLNEDPTWSSIRQKLQEKTNIHPILIFPLDQLAITTEGMEESFEENSYFIFDPRSNFSSDQLIISYDTAKEPQINEDPTSSFSQRPSQELQERKNIHLISSYPLEQTNPVTNGMEESLEEKNHHIIYPRSNLSSDHLTTSSDSAKEPRVNGDATYSSNQTSSEPQENKNDPSISNMRLDQLTSGTDGLDEPWEKENNFINEPRSNFLSDQLTTTYDSLKEAQMNEETSRYNLQELQANTNIHPTLNWQMGQITLVTEGMEESFEENNHIIIDPRSNLSSVQLITSYDIAKEPHMNKDPTSSSNHGLSRELEKMKNIHIKSSSPLGQLHPVTNGMGDSLIHPVSNFPIDQRTTSSNGAKEPQLNEDAKIFFNQTSSEEHQEEKNDALISYLPLGQLSPATDGLEESLKKGIHLINDSTSNMSPDQLNITSDSVKEPKMNEVPNSSSNPQEIQEKKNIQIIINLPLGQLTPATDGMEKSNEENNHFTIAQKPNSSSDQKTNSSDSPKEPQINEDTFSYNVHCTELQEKTNIHPTIDLPLGLLNRVTNEMEASHEEKTNFMYDNPRYNLSSKQLTMSSDGVKETPVNVAATSSSNQRSSLELEENKNMHLITNLPLNQRTTTSDGLKDSEGEGTHFINEPRSNVSHTNVTNTSNSTNEPQVKYIHTTQNLPLGLLTITSDGLKDSNKEETQFKIDPRSNLLSDPLNITSKAAKKPPVNKATTSSSNQRSTLEFEGNKSMHIITNLPLSPHTTTSYGSKDSKEEETHFIIDPRSDLSPDQLTTSSEGEGKKPPVNEATTSSSNRRSSLELEENKNMHLKTNLPLSQKNTTSDGSNDSKEEKIHFINGPRSNLAHTHVTNTSNSTKEHQMNEDHTSSSNQRSSQQLQEEKNICIMPNLPLGLLTITSDGLNDSNKEETHLIIHSGTNVSSYQLTTSSDGAKEPPVNKAATSSSDQRSYLELEENENIHLITNLLFSQQNTTSNSSEDSKEEETHSIIDPMSNLSTDQLTTSSDGAKEPPVNEAATSSLNQRSTLEFEENENMHLITNLPLIQQNTTSNGSEDSKEEKTQFINDPRCNVSHTHVTNTSNSTTEPQMNGDHTSSSNQMPSQQLLENKNIQILPNLPSGLLTIMSGCFNDSNEEETHFIIDPISNLSSDQLTTSSDGAKEPPVNEAATSSTNQRSTLEFEENENMHLITNLPLSHQTTTSDGSKDSKEEETHFTIDPISNLSLDQPSTSSEGAKEPPVNEAATSNSDQRSSLELEETKNMHLITNLPLSQQNTTSDGSKDCKEVETHFVIDPRSNVFHTHVTNTSNRTKEPQFNEDHTSSSNQMSSQQLCRPAITSGGLIESDKEENHSRISPRSYSTSDKLSSTCFGEEDPQNKEDHSPSSSPILLPREVFTSSGPAIAEHGMVKLHEMRSHPESIQRSYLKVCQLTKNIDHQKNKDHVSSPEERLYFKMCKLSSDGDGVLRNNKNHPIVFLRKDAEPSHISRAAGGLEKSKQKATYLKIILKSNLKSDQPTNVFDGEERPQKDNEPMLTSNKRLHLASYKSFSARDEALRTLKNHPVKLISMNLTSGLLTTDNDQLEKCEEKRNVCRFIKRSNLAPRQLSEECKGVNIPMEKKNYFHKLNTASNSTSHQLITPYAWLKELHEKKDTPHVSILRSYLTSGHLAANSAKTEELPLKNSHNSILKSYLIAAELPSNGFEGRNQQAFFRRSSLPLVRSTTPLNGVEGRGEKEIHPKLPQILTIPAKGLGKHQANREITLRSGITLCQRSRDSGLNVSLGQPTTAIDGFEESQNMENHQRNKIINRKRTIIPGSKVDESQDLENSKRKQITKRKRSINLGSSVDESHENNDNSHNWASGLNFTLGQLATATNKYEESSDMENQQRSQRIRRKRTITLLSKVEETQDLENLRKNQRTKRKRLITAGSKVDVSQENKDHSHNCALGLNVTFSQLTTTVDGFEESHNIKDYQKNQKTKIKRTIIPGSNVEDPKDLGNHQRNQRTMRKRTITPGSKVEESQDRENHQTKQRINRKRTNYQGSKVEEPQDLEKHPRNKKIDGQRTITPGSKAGESQDLENHPRKVRINRKRTNYHGSKVEEPQDLEKHPRNQITKRKKTITSGLKVKESQDLENHPRKQRINRKVANYQGLKVEEPQDLEKHSRNQIIKRKRTITPGSKVEESQDLEHHPKNQRLKRKRSITRGSKVGESQKSENNPKNQRIMRKRTITHGSKVEESQHYEHHQGNQRTKRKRTITPGSKADDSQYFENNKINQRTKRETTVTPGLKVEEPQNLENHQGNQRTKRKRTITSGSKVEESQEKKDHSQYLTVGLNVTFGQLTKAIDGLEEFPDMENQETNQRTNGIKTITPGSNSNVAQLNTFKDVVVEVESQEMNFHSSSSILRTYLTTGQRGY